MISDDRVKTLQSLFSWRNEAYGLESYPSPVTVREPLTDSLITDHLEGSKRIGVFLTGTDNRIKSTCLNLNDHNPVKLRKLLVVLIERGIIPYVEKSKSKGYHVWIFLSNPIEALAVRKVLSQILRSEGIDGIEILPKHDSLNPNNGFEDYVFLPLHGGSVRQGKTIFLNNNDLISYDDQWKFLSEAHRTKLEDVIAKIQRGLEAEKTSPDISSNPLPSDSITDLITVENFASLTLPPRNRILSPWLYERSITLVAGWRNTGKTWFGLSIFDAVTREDGAFGPWKVENPVPSLYVDSEMTAQEIQERIKALMLLGGKERAVPFYIYSDALRNLHGLPRSNLLSKTWREEFKTLLLDSGIKLVGFDNISSLTPGIDENLKRDWDTINQWLLELRFAGISSVLLHHTGKTGFQRGTSAREDNIDSTILLEWPEDYKPEEGVRFIARFDKKRVGRDLGLLSDCEFKYGSSSGWAWENVRAKNRIEILRMLNDGIPQVEIAEILGVGRSYVSQVRSKAVEDGYLSGRGKLTTKGIELVRGSNEG